MIRLRALLLGGTVLLAMPTSARAEPSATDIAIAKKLFADATADEQAERWADGLVKLQRVVAIKETAGVRFHIAVCQQNLGALLAARDNFERSSRLAEKVSSSEAKQIVDDAAGAMVRIDQRIPTLMVKLIGESGATTVQIDGAAVDSAMVGKPIKHDPGEARVEASAPGKRRFDKSVVLVDRATVTLEIALQDEDPIAPAVATMPPPSRPATRRERSRVPTAAWFAGGGTLLFAGASIYAFLHRASLVAATGITCADPYVRCDRGARDGRATTYLVGGLVAAGAAVALGGVTVSVVIRGEGASNSAVGFSGGSALVRGTF